MVKSTDFGIVILASVYDELFARGAIASVVDQCPDLPICVLCDGPVNLQAAVDHYGVRLISRSDIRNDWLRSSSFGFGVTKMVLFWESPFEKFFYMDSDAVVWGDPRRIVEQRDFDVMIDIPDHPGDTPEEALKWFFDESLLANYFPDFDPRRYWREFFCTGAFVGTRGSIPLERYRELFLLRSREPRLFRSRGEMGLLNLLLFQLAAEGHLKMDRENIQLLFTEYSHDYLKERFDPDLKRSAESFLLLHMPDSKPLVTSDKCFSKPMTHYRLKYLRDTEKLSGQAAMERLRQEDLAFNGLTKRSRNRDRVQKLVRLAQGHVGEWNRLFYRLRQV